MADTAPTTGSNPDILLLAHGVSLTLEKDSLIIKDKALAKRNRSKLCGIPLGSAPSTITIPYYNILWSDTTNTTSLTIYYTISKSKISLSREKLTYQLPDIPPETAQSWSARLLTLSYGAAQPQRRAKVLINPHAGPGHAVSIWEKEVKPLFLDARMTIDEVQTTRQGEGTDICETLDISAYDMVVVISGDGLAYEVLNGFAKRPDAGKALRQVALAHIPGGSGNALSLNLNGSHRPGPCALAVIKGVRTEVDLMSVTQGDRRLLSFLSQSVGIVAECDLGTENMRWLGAARFDVGIVQRIFSKRVYPCDVAFKTEMENKADIKAHYRRVQRGEASRFKKEVEERVVQGETGDGLPALRFGTVNDEVPEDWEKFSFDNMGNFYCGNMVWMAPNANFFPAALANDGLMDVVINDGNIPAMKYVDLMTGVEKGRFYDNSLISYRKVVAYRFTAKNQKDGYISIDGERIPFEPFQVEIHPGLATMISKSGKLDAFGPTGWEKAE
ncbi:sphingoid long chain base kinase-like protein [Xylariaceae sp. FL1272]|nr:sphingoid long chain base kinase-like protein [Xylariaceae sp. FL1272]